MTSDDVIGHILYASGAKNNQANKTGARTVSDLLILSSLVEENNGKLQVASPTPQTIANEDEALGGNAGVGAEAPAQGATGGVGPSPMIVQVPSSSVPASPTIAINIQLQLPETDKPEVYEELFKALRRHLFPG